MAIPTFPVYIQEFALPKRANAMELMGTTLIVQGEYNLYVADVTDPFAPVTTLQFGLNDKIWDIAAVNEDYLAVATELGLTMVEVQSKTSLVEKSTLLLAYSGQWYSELYQGQSTQGWGINGLINIAAMGSTVALTVDKHVLVVNVSDANSPNLVNTIELTETSESLRFMGYHLYTSTQNMPGYGFVVDLTNPMELLVIGDHWVGDWVRGVMHGDGFAYRVEDAYLRIATVETL